LDLHPILSLSKNSTNSASPCSHPPTPATPPQPHPASSPTPLSTPNPSATVSVPDKAVPQSPPRGSNPDYRGYTRNCLGGHAHSGSRPRRLGRWS
ncbi:MAG: hypothetical protein Q9198_007562, partial [Flavoplaca austrocitrina]